MVSEKVKNVTKLSRATCVGNSGNDIEDALKQWKVTFCLKKLDMLLIKKWVRYQFYLFFKNNNGELYKN